LRPSWSSDIAAISSRLALFIGSLIAQHSSVAIERANLQPVRDEGTGLLDAAQAYIDCGRDVRHDHFVALNVLKRFVITVSEIEVPGEYGLEKPREGGVSSWRSASDAHSIVWSIRPAEERKVDREAHDVGSFGAISIAASASSTLLLKSLARKA
jgi:hypothetical protein